MKYFPLNFSVIDRKGYDDYLIIELCCHYACRFSKEHFLVLCVISDNFTMCD